MRDKNRTYYFSRETTLEELDLNDVIYTVNPVFTVSYSFYKTAAEETLNRILIVL